MILALRERVSAAVDRAIAEDQVRVTITMKDGKRLEKYIEHCVGSARNPMTDAQLEAKFTALAEGILPARRVRRLMDLCLEYRGSAQGGRTGAGGGRLM